MKRAITLVELLVLLAVVCFLGVIFWPPNHGHKRNAQRSSCQSNLKQIGLALMQYGQDFERFPRATGNGAVWGWAEALLPYHKKPEIYECPSENTTRQNDPKFASYTDYWMNSGFSHRKFADFQNPALAIAFGDGDGSSNQSDARYALKTMPQKWRDWENSPARIHLDVANYLFADGHVKSLKAQKIGENWEWKPAPIGTLGAKSRSF